MENKNLIIVNEENFKDIISTEMPVLLDFWAEWCGPCKMLLPIIGELADEFQGRAVIAKVNVDENSKLSEEYGVSNIPTIVILKNGVEVSRAVGFRQKKQLAELIENNI